MNGFKNLVDMGKINIFFYFFLTPLFFYLSNLFYLNQGYIHRDIKPANALIKNGVHKVADFGFATKVDITGRHLIKECVGTPLYMAP